MANNAPNPLFVDVPAPVRVHVLDVLLCCLSTLSSTVGDSDRSIRMRSHFSRTRGKPEFNLRVNRKMNSNLMQ
jgi:hypothetical protein